MFAELGARSGKLIDPAAGEDLLVADLAFVQIGNKREYLGPYNSEASRAEYSRMVSEWLASLLYGPKYSRLWDVALPVACLRWRRCKQPDSG